MPHSLTYIKRIWVAIRVWRVWADNSQEKNIVIRATALHEGALETRRKLIRIT